MTPDLESRHIEAIRFLITHNIPVNRVNVDLYLEMLV